MKRLMLLFCLILLGTISAFAQEENSSDERFYLVGGIQSIATNNLNELLTTNNLPTIPKWHYYMGMGGNDEFGKWVIGGEGYFLFSDVVEAETELKIFGGMGYFYAGFKVVDTEHLKLLPKIGFGGGGMNAQLNQNTTTTLTDFLTTSHSNNLTNGNWLNHFGLKGIINITPTFDIQWDAGYNLGWGSSWNAENSTLSNSVKDNIGGLFFQVSSSFIF